MQIKREQEKFKESQKQVSKASVSGRQPGGLHCRVLQVVVSARFKSSLPKSNDKWLITRMIGFVHHPFHSLHLPPRHLRCCCCDCLRYGRHGTITVEYGTLFRNTPIERNYELPLYTGYPLMQ